MMVAYLTPAFCSIRISFSTGFSLPLCACVSRSTRRRPLLVPLAPGTHFQCIDDARFSSGFSDRLNTQIKRSVRFEKDDAGLAWRIALNSCAS
jgi:hypothetical protein